MTVVIGCITKENVLLASDGYALYQKDETSSIVKSDFYSKIVIVDNGKCIIGTAGSHELSFQLIDNIIEKESPVISQNDSLEFFSMQMKSLNQEHKEKSVSILLGFIDINGPKLYLFETNGKSTQKELVAIGSGADEAINYLAKHYSKSWNISTTISHLIEAIYCSAKIPTVNFVPMISFLTPKGFVDLSTITKKEFEAFKKSLKKHLSIQGVKKSLRN